MLLFYYLLYSNISSSAALETLLWRAVKLLVIIVLLVLYYINIYFSRLQKYEYFFNPKRKWEILFKQKSTSPTPLFGGIWQGPGPPFLILFLYRSYIDHILFLYSGYKKCIPSLYEKYKNYIGKGIPVGMGKQGKTGVGCPVLMLLFY